MNNHSEPTEVISQTPLTAPSSRLSVTFVMGISVVGPPLSGYVTSTTAERSKGPPPLTSLAVPAIKLQCCVVCTGSSLQVSSSARTAFCAISACQHVISGNIPGKATCTKVPSLLDHLNSR